MTDDTQQAIERIIDYCGRKWVEARDQIGVVPVQDADIQTGKKMAYNDVLQFARTLLEEG